MKILHKGQIYEAISTILENKSDRYDVYRIKKDNDHKYQYLNGIQYRLGNEGKDEVIEIGEIEATPENTFYEDQIERYMEYIKNGGIIDSFPVSKSKLAYDLESMLDFLDENSFRKPLTPDIDNEIFRYCPILSKNQGNLFDIYFRTDEGEEFEQYSRINKNARELNEVFPPDNRTADEIALMQELELVFNFFNEHAEFTLTDMNHRFEAVKRLGANAVIVDPVN